MERLTQVGDRVGALNLSDADGAPVDSDGLFDRPVVVALVRYYGCMPCKALLHELNDVHTELADAGLRVIAVGGAADYQARHLMADGIEFPLLLDPEYSFYRALNLRRIHWWMLLSPVTWWKYVRALRRARQGLITGHVLQAPGLAIVDGSRTVRFLHRGTTLGDYPPVPQVVAAARQVVADDRG